MPDLKDVALVIAAGGSFLTSMTTAYIAVHQSRMDNKLDATHRLVNGMSHELQDADKRAAGAEGFIAGGTGNPYEPPSGKAPS